VGKQRVEIRFNVGRVCVKRERAAAVDLPRARNGRAKGDKSNYDNWTYPLPKTCGLVSLSRRGISTLSRSLRAPRCLCGVA
jgi:hypothetical protein